MSQEPIDLTAEYCPYLHMRVREALKDLSPGESITLLLPKDEELTSVIKLIKQDGEYQILQLKREEDLTSLQVKKNEAS